MIPILPPTLLDDKGDKIHWSPSHPKFRPRITCNWEKIINFKALGCWCEGTALERFCRTLAFIFFIFINRRFRREIFWFGSSASPGTSSVTSLASSFSKPVSISEKSRFDLVMGHQIDISLAGLDTVLCCILKSYVLRYVLCAVLYSAGVFKLMCWNMCWILIFKRKF